MFYDLKWQLLFEVFEKMWYGVAREDFLRSNVFRKIPLESPPGPTRTYDGEWFALTKDLQE
uniref:Uncharacterized protein n=1 Tax=Agrobacterium tumefaciens TaxID=358 RepID=A0A2Z2Q1D4_AGRTU|nr:hypothetical protein [Agrobacterium radiobacter]